MNIMSFNPDLNKQAQEVLFSKTTMMDFSIFQDGLEGGVCFLIRLEKLVYQNNIFIITIINVINHQSPIINIITLNKLRMLQHFIAEQTYLYLQILKILI